MQVICQLRFPALLSIESKPPVDFQERIRDSFPILEKLSSGLPAGLPPEAIQAFFGQNVPSSYNFLTADRLCSVTLSPEWIAFSSASYTKWEDFYKQLSMSLDALTDIYRPSFYSRVGLRYQNILDRETLGLQEIPWSQLLRKEILGELALPQFEKNLGQIANRTIQVSLPDGRGWLLMRHGLAQVEARKNPAYMIDLDFFAETPTEAVDAGAILANFNALAGNAFRWCITDTLRDALNPQAVYSTA